MNDNSHNHKFDHPHEHKHSNDHKCDHAHEHIQSQERKCDHAHKHNHGHKHKHNHKHTPPRQNLAYWITGLGALLWLALRTGTKPTRIAYPCQQTAAITGIGFLGYLASITGLAYLYRRTSNKTALVGFGLLAAVLSLTFFISSGAPYAHADVTALPSWTSGTAVSNVFAVENVPIPECSLASGALPGTGACSTPSYALSDGGVDVLVTSMENRGEYFYKTAAHPTGTVGADDVVVIKINNQWANAGNNHRLTTNTDVMKGVIWRILQHPDGFTGEIVVAENTQHSSGATWVQTPANSQDQNQSFQDVIDVFQGLGHPVYLYRWDGLDSSIISGGNVNASGYPVGEYANGDNNDHYILLEDPAGPGTDELSYPKFQTHTGGEYVSMRYGIWDGSSYDADKLTLINMPVLKGHGMAGATIAWKNLIGLVTIRNHADRYGTYGDQNSWNVMHNFYWGYRIGPDPDYGLIGRHLAFIGAPDLNIVDAIWVAANNSGGTGYRQNILLAARDPFAMDWYASEHVLYPIFSSQRTTAARSGVFRDSTRVIQNAAAANWSGSYPFMDLLDDYDENTPSPDEHDQMNVYITDADAGAGTTYNLNTATAGTGGGSVTNSPVGNSCGTGCNGYDDGTVVTLTAVADAGSTFTGWSGAVSGSSNPINVTMDAAKSVTASFALNTYPLAVHVGGTGDGTVQINPPDVTCGDDCSETYDYGTMVTLTAVSSITSTFTGWSGAVSSTTNPLVVTIDAAKSVTATFTVNELALSITGDGIGIVNLNPPDRDCTADCTEIYNEGEMVTLTAVSSITSTFTGWSGAMNSTTNPIVLTMDAAKAVTATFILDELTLTISGTGNGSVYLDPPGIHCSINCSEIYDEGTVVTLTAVPLITSTFTSWTGAINSIMNPITLTMNTAKAVTATFTLNELALTIAGNGDGFVNIDPPDRDCMADCNEVYDEGTMVVLTAVYPITSTFTGWSGALITTTNPITLTMDAAKAITATFTLNELALTIAGNGIGIVNVDPPDRDCMANCNEVYDVGTMVTLTAVADIASESTFAGWSGAINSTNNTITLTMDAAKAVTATFNPKIYYTFLPIIMR